MAAINTIAKEWTDELRAAPVQRKSTSTEERNQQQNGYALWVILFYVLIGGCLCTSIQLCGYLIKNFKCSLP